MIWLYLLFVLLVSLVPRVSSLEGIKEVAAGQCKDVAGNSFNECRYSDYFPGGLDDCADLCLKANIKDGKCEAFSFGKGTSWTGGRWCFLYFTKGPTSEEDCPQAECSSCSRALLAGSSFGNEGIMPAAQGTPSDGGDLKCYSINPGRIAWKSWYSQPSNPPQPAPQQIIGSEVSYKPQPSPSDSGCAVNPGKCQVFNNMGWDYKGPGMCLDSSGYSYNYCHYNSGFPGFDDDCADMCLHSSGCIGVSYGVGPKPGWIGGYHCFLHYPKGDEPSEYACCPALGMKAANGVLYKPNGGQFFGGTPQTPGGHNHNGELVLQQIVKTNLATGDIDGGDGTLNVACFSRGTNNYIQPYKCSPSSPPATSSLKPTACKQHLDHGGCYNWKTLTNDQSIGLDPVRAPGGAEAYVQDQWQQEWGSAQISVDECRKKCMEHPKCQSFSWNRVSCWLYDGNCDAAPLNNHIAGKRGVMPGSQTVTLFQWDSYTDCKSNTPVCEAHQWAGCSNWDNLTQQEWTTKWVFSNLNELACESKCREEPQCVSYTWRSGALEYKGSETPGYPSGEKQIEGNHCYIYPENCIPAPVECIRANGALNSPACYYSYTNCNFPSSNPISNRSYTSKSTIVTVHAVLFGFFLLMGI